MTAQGVGPITALAYRSGIDLPARFGKSRGIGAYLGLTPRKYASGEVDRSGRIRKCGDAMLRSLLFEAALRVLRRGKRWSALKRWGLAIEKRRGLRRAQIAVARKLALRAAYAAPQGPRSTLSLHRMWVDGTEFQWSRLDPAQA